MKRYSGNIWMRLSIILITLLLTLQTIESQTDNWPTFRGDRTLQGASSVKRKLPLQKAWKRKLKQEIIASPVIYNNRIFIATMEGTLFCLNADSGKTVWKQTVESSFEAAPLAVDGRIIIGSASGALYCFESSSGKIIWKYLTEGKIIGSASWFTRKKNTLTLISVGSYDNFLHTVSLDEGKRVWLYQTDSYINGTASIDNHSIYFGGCDGKMHIVDHYGRQVASIEVGSYIAGSISVRDNRLYSITYDGLVVAADNKEHTILWKYKLDKSDSTVVASPALNSKYLLVASRDGNCYTFDPSSGALLAQFYAGSAMEASPVLLGDMAMVSTMDGRIYIFNPETGEELWSYDCGAAIQASPAITDSLIITAATDGYVYAFK